LPAKKTAEQLSDIQDAGRANAVWQTLAKGIFYSVFFLLKIAMQDLNTGARDPALDRPLWSWL